MVIAVSLAATLAMGLPGGVPELHAQFHPVVAATSDAEAIAERARQFSAAYVAGDIDGLMDYYTEGAVGMPGGRTPMVGRAALHRYWRVPEGVEIVDHETVSEDLRVVGDIAIDRGTYRGSSRRNGELRVFEGRYLVVWTRGEDGLWRMSEDMWAQAE